MRTMSGAALLACGLFTSTGIASAASPERCIIYARDFSLASVVPAPGGATPAVPRQDIQDAAYARCLKHGPGPIPAPRVAAAIVPGAPEQAQPAAEAVEDTNAPNDILERFKRAFEERATLPYISPVSSYAEAAPPKAAGQVKVAEIFAASDPEIRGTIVSCQAAAGRTRFWRGLMMPAESADHC
jgi:hypothetical protein